MVRRPFILCAFKPIFVVFTDYRPEPRADLAMPVCGAKIEAELACANGLSVMSYNILSKALYLRLSPLQALVLRAPSISESGSARQRVESHPGVWVAAKTVTSSCRYRQCREFCFRYSRRSIPAHPRLSRLLEQRRRWSPYSFQNRIHRPLAR